MAALISLPLLLLLPLFVLRLLRWSRLRWLMADLAFTVRALRCKRALQARVAAAAAADPRGPEGGCSLAWRLSQLVRECPGRTFLIHRGRHYSYAQAEHESNRVARAFLRVRGWEEVPNLAGGAAEKGAKDSSGAGATGRSEGGKPPPLESGSVVALLLPATPEFLWLWFGLAKAGLQAAFVPTALRRGPLLHCLRSCGARALVVAPEFLESLGPDLPDLEDLNLKLWAAGPGPHPEGFSDLLAEAAAQEGGPLPGYLSAPKSILDTCLYIFTSGTTGLPKAARISHMKVLQCQGFYQLCGVHPDDVIYLTLPLYHMSGSLLGIVGCLGIGATVVLKTKFSASQFWEDCREHGVTVFQYIGELCRYLVNQPPVLRGIGEHWDLGGGILSGSLLGTRSEGDRNHRVRLAVGSGLRPDIWTRFLQRFGPLQILETYGLTEGNVATFNYIGYPGAVGRASWLYKLFSPFSLIRYDVATGEPVRDAWGLCVPVPTGSPKLARGKLLHNVFRPGDVFFNTGDLLVCDAQGFLHFHDRTGDTFRWKGENVATTEVAKVLGTLDMLQDVNVYGVTVPGHEGRAGMAAVVLRPHHTLDLDRFYAHVAEILPPYAQPRFLRIQESLDTTETFKQQKVRLAKEGFNPSTVHVPLFVLDQTAGAYVSLTPAWYDALLAGQIRI
ncbi:long-chain fatty acid transport protein 3 isoform X2 [Sminthopsis crassicaudata]|uniref:long-chain fatty acid transport protein 3 isoform X2 n=1 Tax=Sminthopsis crassicaudata TaxID=9301 RepID=UPI003D694E72